MCKLCIEVVLITAAVWVQTCNERHRTAANSGKANINRAALHTLHHEHNCWLHGFLAVLNRIISHPACLQVVSEIMKPDWSANVLVSGWVLNALQPSHLTKLHALQPVLLWSCGCWRSLWSHYVPWWLQIQTVGLRLIRQWVAYVYFTPLDVTFCGLTSSVVCTSDCLCVTQLHGWRTQQIKAVNCGTGIIVVACRQSHRGTGTILTGFALDRNWQFMFWRG